MQAPEQFDESVLQEFAQHLNSDGVEKAQAAKQKIVEHYLKLVNTIAEKFHNQGIDKGELISEAYIALDRAVDRLNPEQFASFNQYIRLSIYKQIKRYLLRKSYESIVNPSFDSAQKYARIQKTIKQWVTQNGTAPTDEQLIAALGIVEKYMKSYHVYGNRDSIADIDPDTLPEDQQNPEQIALQNEALQMINQWFDKMNKERNSSLFHVNDRDRTIFVAYHTGEKSISELAGLYDISVTNVRDILNTVSRTVQRYIYKNNIEV